MSSRKIYLASPAEPSGASWIINCLLELGIRVDHKPAVDRLWRTARPPPPPSRLWIPEGAGWRLHHRAQVLGKWLPALMRHQTFRFRDDLVVEYLQELPRPQHAGQTIAFFLRDPRDSIYSMFRRRQVRLGFPEFCRFPNPHTLLPAADHWLLYAQGWRQLAGTRVFRFEDYKRDAVALLHSILASLGLDFPDREIHRAAVESSFEKAKAAETRYREIHPGDWEVANRAGQVGNWREYPELSEEVIRIERRCGALLAQLGYSIDVEPQGPELTAVAQFHFLDIFRRVLLPAEAQAVRHLEPLGHESLSQVLDFAHGLDKTRLTDANLSPHDSRSLLTSLDEFIAAYRERLGDRLKGLASAFSDGSAQHLDVLRDLLRRSRTLRRGSEGTDG